MTKQQFARNNTPEGCYTYAYLRKRSSPRGPAGSPYYIGKGTSTRAWDDHGPRNNPPANEYILILKWGMDDDDAYAHEEYMTNVFGIRTEGGMLTKNNKHGGDGGRGYVHTEEHREHMSRLMTGRKCPWAAVPCPPERRKRIGESQKGKIITQEQRKQISFTLTGRTQSEETKCKRANTMRRVLNTPEARQRMSAAAITHNKKEGVRERKAVQMTQRWADPVQKATISKAITLSKAAKKAAEFDFTPEEWMSLTKTQRETAGSVLPKAQALGYTLREWWALPRSEKISQLAELRRRDQAA